MTSKAASVPKSAPPNHPTAPSPAAAAAAAAAASATAALPQQQQQQQRRRRESSDDFLATASLGSIGGSLMGSSLGDSNNKPRAHSLGSSSLVADIRARTQSLEFSAASKGSTINNAGVNSAAHSALSPINSHSANSSPAARRPFRKRKGSVDFSLSIDDHDSTLPALLPQNATASSLLPSSALNARSRHNSDATCDSAATSPKILPSIDALPPMEALPPIDDSATLLVQPPSSPLHDGATGSIGKNSASNKDRAMSFGSSKTEGRGLDHLDHLGVEAAMSAARIRKESISERSNRSQGSNDESNNSHGTLNSQSQRFLLEAFLGDGNESLVLNPSQRERLGSFDVAAFIGRERLGSFDAAAAATAIGKGGSFSSKDQHHATHALTAPAVAHRDRLSSIGGRRDRLESWGGMSDLSAAGLHDQHSDTVGSGGTATAAALAATIYTSLANDVSAAAGVGDENESISSFLVNEEAIPDRISVNRDRLNSVASFATDPSALFHITAPSSNSVTDFGFSSDVHKYVKEAMASVEDELADLATSVEAVITTGIRERDHDESEVSSTASPMIGAASDIGSNKSGSITGRLRSSSISSFPHIAVDYDAVAAAVNAAEAVDLNALGANSKSGESSISGLNRKKRALPLNKGRTAQSFQKQYSHPPPGSETFSQREERDMEEIRARARAAAGYVPPPGGSLPPPKKRAKMLEASHSSQLATPSGAKLPVTTSSDFKTPLISNTGSSRVNGPVPFPAFSASTPASAGRGQPSQKWEAMYECLLEFVEEQKRAETKGMSEVQKQKWEWDGNVPTTYKTKDGKALGRWVNNQRSAKSKGSLKDDRETRLVNAGLKWSVLASSSWNEMLEELRSYIADQEKQGRKWNGNVPTNYKIKASKDNNAFIKEDDEDKNLGRWVNRQRSMYQAGKLRKDRQEALEKIGLKWSILATTTWDSMFETLEEYVRDKTRNGSKWDGNVPANYRTNHDPPRALGRWINRQRSAFGKQKLKSEYESKLNELGLKWSVHERRPSHQYSNKIHPDIQGSADMSADHSNDSACYGVSESAADPSDRTDGDAAAVNVCDSAVKQESATVSSPKGPAEMEGKAMELTRDPNDGSGFEDENHDDTKFDV